MASISRVVDYINGYRSSFGLCKRFVPIKIRNLFVDDGKVDDEAVKCLSWLLLSKTVANSILWMQCSVSFQQAAARRELLITEESFISAERLTDIIELSRIRVHEKPAQGKVRAVKSGVLKARNGRKRFT